jgi:hypothetical protein
MKRRFAAPAALAAALLACPSLLGADFPEGANQPFHFELGGFWSAFDTTARLDVTRNGLLFAGTTVDFEKLLNLPTDKATFRGGAFWRFTKRNYLDFGYDSLNRSGSRTAEGEVNWGDLTFSAGARLDGKFDNTNVYLGWHYDMFAADNVRFWGGLGFAYTQVTASLSGQARLTRPDGTTQTGQFERGFDIKAPVPVIGLGAEGAISSHFTFAFRMRAVYINLSQYAGGILMGGLQGRWYATKNFGLVLGIDYETIRITKYLNEDKDLTATYSFSGPTLAAIVAF